MISRRFHIDKGVLRPRAREANGLQPTLTAYKQGPNLNGLN